METEVFFQYEIIINVLIVISCTNGFTAFYTNLSQYFELFIQNLNI